MQVTLDKPHIHSGRRYPVGAALTLRPDQASWLIALGVAHATPSTASQAAKKEKNHGDDR